MSQAADSSQVLFSGKTRCANLLASHRLNCDGSEAGRIATIVIELDGADPEMVQREDSISHCCRRERLGEPSLYAFAARSPTAAQHRCRHCGASIVSIRFVAVAFPRAADG